jgi:hypothetical protein
LNQHYRSNSDERLAEATKLARELFFEPFYAGSTNTDNDALCVQENEVGYTTNKRIGTINATECLMVAIKNPANGRVAMIHINNKTKASSLDAVFAKLGDPNGQNFEVKIVGAKVMTAEQRDMLGVDPKDTRPQENVKKVLGYLSGRKDVNVTTCQILKWGQPVNIIVEPKSFTLSEELALNDPDRIIVATGASIIEDANQPLREAFDLDEHHGYKPIIIRKFMPMMEVLSSIERPDFAVIHGLLNSKNEIPMSPMYVEAPFAIAQYAILHRKAAMPLLEQAIHKIEEHELSGRRLLGDLRKSAKAALFNAHLAVGEGSERHNAQFAQFIQDQWINVKDGNASINTIGLRSGGR